jgi:hypothetical protein
MTTGTLKQSTSFLYEDNFISFVADPGDIRSCAIFFDDHSDQWCAGVTVRENYSKLRFVNELAARKFIKALHVAKQEELARLMTNSDVRDQRKVG